MERSLKCQELAVFVKESWQLTAVSSATLGENGHFLYSVFPDLGETEKPPRVIGTSSVEGTTLSDSVGCFRMEVGVEKRNSIWPRNHTSAKTCVEIPKIRGLGFPIQGQ